MFTFFKNLKKIFTEELWSKVDPTTPLTGAVNGLSLDDTESRVKLGGTLTEDTEILVGNRFFTIRGLLQIQGDIIMSGKTTAVAGLDSQGKFNAHGYGLFDKDSSTTNPTLTVGGNNPQFDISNGTAAKDQKRWNFFVDSDGNVLLRSLSDAGDKQWHVLNVSRDGAATKDLILGRHIESITLGNGKSPITIPSLAGQDIKNVVIDDNGKLTVGTSIPTLKEYKVTDSTVDDGASYGVISNDITLPKNATPGSLLIVHFLPDNGSETITIKVNPDRGSNQDIIYNGQSYQYIKTQYVGAWGMLIYKSGWGWVFLPFDRSEWGYMPFE